MKATPRSRPAARAVVTALALAATVLPPAAVLPEAAADPGPVRKGNSASGPAERLRGTLLSAEPLRTAAALPSAARNERVRYLSTGARGRPVVVSGTVSTPRTPPPPGGWPVISWAHGTTGTADVCAPSADTENGPAHDYLAGINQTLDTWVARGYAVVQTDYEGLGTPGEHPYLNADSAARSVLDIVRAARKASPRVGRDWIAMGHSQGGHAALAAASKDRGVRDVRLLGAVALAPGGVGIGSLPDHLAPDSPGIRDTLGFLPIVLIGAGAADPDVDPDALLTEEAAPLLDAARTGCLGATRAAAETVPTDRVLRPGSDLRPLTDYLNRQDPTGLTPEVPVLIAQGTDDALVAKPGTDHLVRQLCTRARDISYSVYPGADHRRTVTDSLADTRRFVAALREGDAPGATC